MEDFYPDPSLSREDMEDMQRRIGQEARFEDILPFSLSFPLTSESSLRDVTVVGVDQAFLEDEAVSGIVVMENNRVVERVHATAEVSVPYIPGLLAFREAPAILEAFEKLSSEPQVALFDGSGRIHFRQAGIATHVGVILDIPSIGVAKNLLCGKPKRPLDSPLREGERVPILADEKVSAPENEVIGYAFQSRQFDNVENRYINPLYVSPGHRLSPETSVDVVERFCTDYKLPEPIRLADRYVDEVKDELR